MKRVRFFLSIAVVVALMTACNQNVENAKSIAQLTENDVPISRIDPTDWYVGLKNPSLQLMVYGKGIRDAEVSVSGAKIDSLVCLDSPNYLLVYLNVKGCKPGTLPLTFTQGNKHTTIAYELKQRDMAGDERIGFSNADVLYLLMPDLNQRNPHVLKYLIQNSIWWIETIGINGIRMDTYPYADRIAMAEWMRVLGEETDGWWHGYNRIYNSLVYDYLYENPSNVMAFIENHDTDQLQREAKDVVTGQKYDLTKDLTLAPRQTLIVEF